MKDDPAIDAIREVRHRISEEHGHDPERLVAYYMELDRREESAGKDGRSMKSEPVQVPREAYEDGNG